MKERILFNDWLFLWLENHKKDIKESTYVIYYLNITKHLINYFDLMYLEDIDNLLIQDFIENKRINGRLDGKGGLSNKTIKELLNIIKLSLSYAYKHNLIEYKYIDYSLSIKKTNFKLLSDKDYSLLLSCLKSNNSSFNQGILLMMCTGIRIGELSALKNSDIDLDMKVIKINKTLQRITDTNSHKTKVIITETKTNNSTRIIPIPDSLLPYICLKSNDYYFLTQSYSYMEPRNIRYKFKKIINELNIENITVHSLRHQFASRCVELGFDYNSLSEILGHASPSTTMNLYVHSKMEHKKKCMNRIRI